MCCVSIYISFLISLLTYFLAHWMFGNVFNCYIICNINQLSSWWWFLVYTLVVGKDTWYDFGLLKTHFDLTYDLSWRLFCVCLGRMCVLFLLNGRLLISLLAPFGLWCSSSTMFHYWSSVQVIDPLLTVLRSLIIALLSNYAFNSTNICSVYLGAPILSKYILNIPISSWRSDLFFH